jgi:hypothetical protein
MDPQETFIDIYDNQPTSEAPKAKPYGSLLGSSWRQDPDQSALKRQDPNPTTLPPGGDIDLEILDLNDPSLKIVPTHEISEPGTKKDPESLQKAQELTKVLADRLIDEITLEDRLGRLKTLILGMDDRHFNNFMEALERLQYPEPED